MNATNRGLNRVFLLVVGLLLVAAGGLAGLLALAPAVASVWRSSVRDLPRSLPAGITTTRVGQAPSVVLVVTAVSVVLALLLVVFVLRRGGGRTGTVVGRGPVAVDVAVPRALLADRLERRPDLTGVRVSAYRVKGAPMLKVSAGLKRGADPADAARAVSSALTELDSVLGVALPALVQITGGVRRARRTR